jgi:hypothetical protein
MEHGVWAIDPFVSTKYPALAFMHPVCPVWFCQVPVAHGVWLEDPFTST